MTSQNTSEIPAERIYEIIGRLYIQLYLAQSHQSELMNQIDFLSSQYNILRDSVSQSKLQSSSPQSLMKPPAEALAELVSHGVEVKRVESLDEQTK